METFERVHQINNEYKDLFQKVLPQSFFNCLWQIMVNDLYGSKVKCFSATFDQSQPGAILVLVICNEPGYIPMAYFESSMIEDCEAVVTELNEKVFDISEDFANKIVWSSMDLVSDGN